jgi:hypothetical protein
MQNDEFFTPDVELDDTQNNEVEVENNNSDDDDTPEPEVQQDTTDWKAEALKYKAIAERHKDKPRETKQKSSDDLDYGQKAYLTANGIKGSKEFEFVKEELKQSGQDLDSLLENDYFKSRLDKFRAVNKTADAIPTGKRSGGVPTDSVEYWMTKDISEVPHDMRVKVVNARLAKENKSSMFYNR